jgi:alpha-L-fucosidase
LEVNGEAIFNSTPWYKAEEGITKLATGGMFSEFPNVKYTPDDIRFLVKDNAIYAITLGWPGEELKIKTLRSTYRNPHNLIIPALNESDIKSIKMLGIDEKLEWTLTEKGLIIRTPKEKPCEHAYTFKISMA